jgi:hypothetical protein
VHQRLGDVVGCSGELRGVLIGVRGHGSSIPSS